MTFNPIFKILVSTFALLCSVLFLPAKQTDPFEMSRAFVGTIAAQVSTSPPVVPSKTTGFDLGNPRNDPGREWTILVYMVGDNNLEAMALKDINEMEKGIDGPVEIIVLIDRAKGFDRSEGDWSDARIYRIRKDNDEKRIHSELLAKLGELNMGTPDVLRDFLRSALATFPAKHHALILWDHGGGWQSHANDSDAPGQPQGEDYLTLPELHRALHEALAEVGIDKLDLIGFDMCLMGQLETAAEMKDLARVMVASEALEPGDGWPYERVLPEFGKGTRGVRNIAVSIVRHYGENYRDLNKESYTLSAIDLQRTDDVLDAFDALTEALEKGLDRDWPKIARSIFFSESYLPRSKVQRGPRALASIDLMDALKRIRNNSGTLRSGGEYERLLAEMDRMILATTSGAARRLSNGLAIYAPVSQSVFNSRYNKTRLAGMTRWKKTLKELYRKEKEKASRLRIHDMKLVDFSKGTPTPTTQAMPLGAQGIHTTVEGTDILWIRASFGKKSSGNTDTKIYLNSLITDSNWMERRKKTAADELDYMIPQYKDGVNTHVILYQGYHLKVSNGTKSAYATINIPLNSGMISVPILYNYPGMGWLRASVYFDEKWQGSRSVVLEIPQKDGTVFYQSVKPDPTTEITLLFETVAKDGNHGFVRGKTIQWKGGLDLVVAFDPPGEYELTLTAETIGGKPVVARYPFRVVENPLIKSISQSGGASYRREDLYGLWYEIDADRFFRQSQIVKTDGAIELSPHPKVKALLVATRSSLNNPDQKLISVGWLEQGDSPVLRLVPIEGTKGTRRDKYRQDYLTFLVPLPNGKKLMYRIDLASHKVSLYLKMKGGSGKTGTPSSSAGPLSPPTSANAAGQTTTPIPVPSMLESLQGQWISEGGEILQLDSKRYRLSINGRIEGEGTYRVENSTLILYNSNNTVTRLSIRLEGDTLILRMSNGKRFLFHRRKSASSSTSPSPNRRLRGTYCSYSGGNGYARSDWATFDGRGNFQYGSSYSNSGGSGNYYNQGAAQKGRYRVEGNTILLFYPDGSSDRATVYRQTSDGTITEIQYGNRLYASSLCR